MRKCQFCKSYYILRNFGGHAVCLKHHRFDRYNWNYAKYCPDYEFDIVHFIYTTLGLLR